MIFVDTSAWYALFVAEDRNHDAAGGCCARFRRSNERLITSTFVVDELMTLLLTRAPNGQQVCERVGRDLRQGRFTTVEWVTKQDFDSAWRTFDKHADKQWSFTDCTSLVVMQRLRIDRAFAFDKHFRQFGTVTVLPG